MGTPTHDPASACSELSIAALVLAKHERTGLVRAMRGEGGLALAGMAKKASGGRLFSSVWRQAERSAASSGHLSDLVRRLEHHDPTVVSREAQVTLLGQDTEHRLDFRFFPTDHSGNFYERQSFT